MIPSRDNPKEIRLPLWYVADNTPVDGASSSNRIRICDDDEWRLLQERDLHMELLWNTLRGNMTVVGPNYVLDVQSSLRGPGSNLDEQNFKLHSALTEKVLDKWDT